MDMNMTTTTAAQTAAAAAAAAPEPAGVLRYTEQARLQARAEAAEQARQEALERVELLSPAERTVLELLCKGLTHREAAQALDCAANTISEHARRVQKKLEVANIVEAAVLAAKAGVV